MAKAKKEKLIRLEGYDDLDGCLVPESWLPQGDDWGNGFLVKDGELIQYKNEDEDVVDVVIPEGITKLKRDVFSGQSIHSVTIPKSLTFVSTDSFQYCYSLKTLNVADGHPTYHIENNCLIDTKNKTLVMGLNNCFIPTSENVVKIASHAFGVNGWGCRNNNFIPSNITEIAPYGFAGCGLYNLSIPPTIKKMGKGAFAFCDNLKTVVIEEGVTKISEDAFNDCDFLTNVTLPESLKIIGKRAFFNCKRLENVNIPSNLKKIGYAAFCWSNNWCNGLNGNLVIPKNLKIDYVSFPCESINSISVEEGNPYYYCENNCLIEKDTKTLVLGCKNSIIPNYIKKIDRGAFYFCLGIKKLVIPDSVEEIGKNAFRFCRDLVSVVIPNSVKKIDEGAFCCRDELWWSLALKNVTIPRRFENQNNIFDNNSGIKFKYTD